MWKSFCNWLLYKRWGWKTEVTEDHPDKFIICLAPHTSNWDFVLGQLYSGACGMQSNFLMKKSGSSSPWVSSSNGWAASPSSGRSTPA